MAAMWKLRRSILQGDEGRQWAENAGATEFKKVSNGREVDIRGELDFVVVDDLLPHVEVKVLAASKAHAQRI